MVVKEEAHTRSRWGRNGDVRDVPVEVKVMSRLNKTRCHAVPRLFNYKRYPHVYKHRFYMEYCPFQDLSILCKRYGRFRFVAAGGSVVSVSADLTLSIGSTSRNRSCGTRSTTWLRRLWR